MIWLTIWLKKIILLVLLAAFLDLILPNTSMQRYVKMVMGLILLLTIISPVFSLFHLSQEDLALRLNRYQEQFSRAPADEWRSIAGRLASEQNEQMTEYVQQQMEAAIRAQVKSDFGLELGSVEVSLDVKNSEQPEIKQIELTLADAEETEEKSSGIKPIQPIEIKVGETKPGEREAKPVASQSNPLYRQIAGAVAREWNVPPDQVNVYGTADRPQAQ
jgi:stage III sporulation protein AF